MSDWKLKNPFENVSRNQDNNFGLKQAPKKNPFANLPSGKLFKMPKAKKSPVKWGASLTVFIDGMPIKREYNKFADAKKVAEIEANMRKAAMSDMRKANEKLFAILPKINVNLNPEKIDGCKCPICCPELHKRDQDKMNAKMFANEAVKAVEVPKYVPPVYTIDSLPPLLILPSDKKRENSPRGAFGFYVKLNDSEGIKITMWGASDAKTAFSRGGENAMQECEYLRCVEQSGFTPKGAEVYMVRMGETYGVGIKMEHFGEIPLSTMPWEDGQNITLRLIKKFNDDLLKYGIKHGDIHHNNIMIYRGEYKLIDFSPGLISDMRNIPEEQRKAA